MILIRRLTTAALVSMMTAVAAAQPAAPEIAIEGPTLQPIARYENGKWTQLADVLRCAKPGGLERVVATGGASAGLLEPIARDDDDWKALEAPIVRLFERRELELDLAAANLARAPIQIDWVYMTPRPNGVRIYYFEASRRVPDPGTASEDDPKGTLRIVVSGWMQRAGTNLTVLGSKSELGWEQDRPQVDTSRPRAPELRPLGIVTHGSGSIWVMKGGVGDIGWVTAYLVGEFGVQAFVNGARCAR
jgi:hypothetical protein